MDISFDFDFLRIETPNSVMDLEENDLDKSVSKSENISKHYFEDVFEDDSIIEYSSKRKRYDLEIYSDEDYNLEKTPYNLIFSFENRKVYTDDCETEDDMDLIEENFREEDVFIDTIQYEDFDVEIEDRIIDFEDVYLDEDNFIKSPIYLSDMDKVEYIYEKNKTDEYIILSELKIIVENHNQKI